MANNYQIQAEAARELFLKEDFAALIRKFNLPSDNQYIYLRFMDITLNIERTTGKIANISGSDTHTPMGVYDYLCYSRGDRRLSGEWTTAASLGRMFHRELSENDMPSQTALYFDERADKLAEVCEQLGGVRTSPGDVSYTFMLFDELPVWLQLWRGDDEFPARLSLLWDKNALQYVHYETLYYIAEMMYGRLRGLIRNAEGLPTPSVS
jgi:hypothetical protein